MIAESSYGTYRVGGWVRASSPEAINDEVYKWQSHQDDPYNGVLVSQAIFRRFRISRDQNVKRVCEMLWSRGITVAIELNDGTHRQADSYDDIMAIIAERDPSVLEKYIAEYTKLCWDERAFRLFIDAARPFFARDRVISLCVNPGCFKTRPSDTPEGGAVQRCPSCGGMTMVCEHDLSPDVGPKLIPYSFYSRRLEGMNQKMNAIRWVFSMEEESGGVWFPLVVDGRGLCIATNEAPHLRAGKRHFIRARSNIRTLQAAAPFRKLEQGNRQYVYFLSAQDIRSVIATPNLEASVRELMLRYAADPTKILDESHANLLRMEIIEEVWVDEYRKVFIDEMISRGLIDSEKRSMVVRNLQPMIDVIYNGAANSGKIKVIIKKDGFIDFKISEVAKHVSSKTIELAREITETKPELVLTAFKPACSR